MDRTCKRKIGGGGRFRYKLNVKKLLQSMHMAGFLCLSPLLAAADMFDIDITGKGGHAAAPHQAIDPNVAAAHILRTQQQRASRVVSRAMRAWLSIGVLLSLHIGS